MTPLTAQESAALLELADRQRDDRAVRMPDEKAALLAMSDSYTRLEELGYQSIIYCPKDGSEFLAIEPGCTEPLHCVYLGEWPDGGWWVFADGDMGPSHPVLFKALK